nr:hypothetical protein [uncultured Albidiferax sp.]
MQSTTFTPRAVVLAVAVALGGCATHPIVQWQVPTPVEKPPERTLDYANSVADAARTAYQKAIVGQLEESTNLSNTLVVGGALATALAMGGVHRDAITGVAMVGGTAYALGNLGLSRPRLLVYQAGVEAINCAKRAVSPFNVEVTEQDALVSALQYLAGQREATEVAQRKVTDALAYFTKKGDGISDIVVLGKITLQSTAEVQKHAGEAQATGNGLVLATRRAGSELLFAVDRIDASVVRGVLDTVPDLSAVPRVIAGLAGLYDQIAPGAGVGKRATTGLTTLGAAMAAAAEKSKISPEQTLLVATTRQLQQATVTLAERLADVNVLVAGRTNVWAADAFKDCGVPNLVQTLASAPTAIDFVAGSEAVTRSIAISGGVKPYFVEFEGAAVAGVTAKQPLPFESRAEVAFTKDAKAPKSLSLRILDSSSPNKVLTVAVTVSAAAPPAKPVVQKPGAASPQTPANGAAALNPVVLALKKHGGQAIPNLPSGMRMRGQATVKNGIVTVPMRCEETVAAADKPTKEVVVAALRLLAGVVVGDAVVIEPNAQYSNASSCLQ